MRMNTIDNEKLNSRKNLNQKLSFPNLFNLKTYSNKISSLSSQKRFYINNKKLASIKKPFHFTKKLKNEINFIHMLDIDNSIKDTIEADLNLKKQKLKIDNNNTIKKLRLGLYKKKTENNKNDMFDDKTEVNNDKNDENNNKVFNVIEKDKENEQSLEKIENDLKDKERIAEKKLEEKKENLNKVKNELKIIGEKLNEINGEIDDDKMEEKILIDYADEFDANYEKSLIEKDKEKEELLMEKERMENYAKFDQRNSNKSANHFMELNKKKYQEMEYMKKLNIFRQKREDKKKALRDTILQKEDKKFKLESELIKKRKILNKIKQDFHIVRNDLINKYHLKLYEGITIHNEGLPSIIKEIWKLDSEINTNYMPSYLDPLCIKFLFQKAKQSIEVNKLRKIIKDAEIDFASDLKNFVDNNEDLINPKDIIGLKLFGKNDDRKIGNNTMEESELFKTKISDISISYLDPYPKTKQFILDYRKKNPNKFKKEMPKVEFKNLKFKSMNIPGYIIEKNKKIEKLKYLLEIKLEQNKLNDKKEVERLNKEFIINNYQEKYNVNVETLFGALFGDKKNEMLIYYARLEKDFKDNKKLIQFHTKYNNLKLKEGT